MNAFKKDRWGYAQRSFYAMLLIWTGVNEDEKLDLSSKQDKKLLQEMEAEDNAEK